MIYSKRRASTLKNIYCKSPLLRYGDDSQCQIWCENSEKAGSVCAIILNVLPVCTNELRSKDKNRVYASEVYAVL